MILDNLVALRILYLMVTPFSKQKAYELGVINDTGEALLKIKDMSDEQKTNYTMLHRLVFRLKRLLEKIPGGKTRIASFAAAYMLVKECVKNNSEPENLEKLFEDTCQIVLNKQMLNEDSESFDMIENAEKMVSMIDSVIEQMSRYGFEIENVVTTTGGLASYSQPIGLKRRKKNVDKSSVNI